MVVAGGGTPGGSVIGSTTADGGYPADRPVHPSDLILTVMQKMGLDRLELFGRDSAVLGSAIDKGFVAGILVRRLRLAMQVFVDPLR